MLEKIKDIANETYQQAKGIANRLPIKESGLALLVALALEGCGTCPPKQYAVFPGGCKPCSCSSDYDCSGDDKCNGCTCYDPNPLHESKRSLRQQGILLPHFNEYK